MGDEDEDNEPMRPVAAVRVSDVIPIASAAGAKGPVRGPCAVCQTDGPLLHDPLDQSSPLRRRVCAVCQGQRNRKQLESLHAAIRALRDGRGTKADAETVKRLDNAPEDTLRDIAARKAAGTAKRQKERFE